MPAFIDVPEVPNSDSDPIDVKNLPDLKDPSPAQACATFLLPLTLLIGIFF
jgi:hypothetical protein